ncbi:unnamed protein product [Amoebophrya sp. A25]|nr:unnamed protein product [Amoebophrya sp. A25]|eukprot:GSA25T00019383001.1
MRQCRQLRGRLSTRVNVYKRTARFFWRPKVAFSGYNCASTTLRRGPEILSARRFGQLGESVLAA